MYISRQKDDTSPKGLEFMRRGVSRAQFAKALDKPFPPRRLPTEAVEKVAEVILFENLT
jgi:hypothetical protein